MSGWYVMLLTAWADAATQWAVNRWENSVVVRGTDAFVAAGPAGLQVYAVSRPSNLRPPALVDLPAGDAVRDLLVADHCTVGIGYKSIQVFDLADPTRPRRLGSLATQYYVADVAVSGTLAYLAEGPSRWNVDIGSQLSVVDLSDPTNPRQVGACPVEGGARSVAVSGHIALVAAGERGLMAIDVNNPAEPTEVGRYDTSGQATDVAVRGHYAYVADGTAGLQVIAISNPLNLVGVGGCNTGGAAAQALNVAARSRSVRVNLLRLM